MIQEHIIPPITEPLGKAWQAPDRSEIEIDHQYARMKRSAFNKLLDYSRSTPTGVYAGKMWKAGDGKHNWWLHWFSESDKPDMCNHNVREIIIHED